MDYLGHWKRELAGGEVAMKVPWLESGDPGQIEVKIPEGIKGAWLFAWITDGADTLCEHDVQFEVEAEEETDPEVFYWNPVKPDREVFSGFTGRMVTDKRRVWWASGSGRATWHVQVPENFCGSRRLRLEMSSCECLEGTRLTDEKRYPSGVRIYVQGKLCGSSFFRISRGTKGRCFPMPGRWKRGVSLIAGPGRTATDSGMIYR